MFHKTLDLGEAGDNVGVLLRGISHDQIQRGQVLAEPGSIQTHKNFKGEVYVMTKEEGDVTLHSSQTTVHNSTSTQLMLLVLSNYQMV